MRNSRHIILLVMTISFAAGQWACGQATYLFENLRPGSLNAPVFDAAGLRLFGTNYVAVLYGGPSPDSLAIGEAYRVGGPMTPEPFDLLVLGGGYFDGGIVAFWTVGCGQIGSLQVRAWDTRLGATYDQVAALGVGGYGASTVFETRGGCGGPGLPTAPAVLIGLESFSLVPEPNPLFLFALGSPLLVLFYRRRSRRVL